jgi:hypothetical protein
MKPQTLLVLVSLPFIFINCKVRERKLYGQWDHALSKLNLKKDHTFSFSDQHYVDDSLMRFSYAGTWSFSNKTIQFYFNNLPDSNIFGGCRSMQVFNRRKMARSWSCTNKAPGIPIFFTKTK